MHDHAGHWFLILLSAINFSIDFDCQCMSLTKLNKKDSNTVKVIRNLSCMSGLPILLNKHLNNTSPLKSLGKIPHKQQSGTFDTCSLDFRELLPFKSFCLGTNS